MSFSNTEFEDAEFMTGLSYDDEFDEFDDFEDDFDDYDEEDEELDDFDDDADLYYDDVFKEEEDYDEPFDDVEAEDSLDLTTHDSGDELLYEDDYRYDNDN